MKTIALTGINRYNDGHSIYVAGTPYHVTEDRAAELLDREVGGHRLFSEPYAEREAAQAERTSRRTSARRSRKGSKAKATSKTESTPHPDAKTDGGKAQAEPEQASGTTEGYLEGDEDDEGVEV